MRNPNDCRRLLAAALLAVPLSSCTVKIQQGPISSAQEDTLAVDSVVTQVVEAPTAPRAVRHPRHLNTDAIVEQEEAVTGAFGEDSSVSPACLQLAAAETRLEIARQNYAEALDRFGVQIEERQRLLAEDGTLAASPAVSGFPAQAHREYVTALMAVRALQKLCPDNP